MGKQHEVSLKEQVTIKWNLISTKPFPEKQNLIKQLITEHIQTSKNYNSLFCCLSILCDTLNPNYNSRQSKITLSYFKDFLTERTKPIIVKIEKYLGLFQKFNFQYCKRDNESITTVTNEHEIGDYSMYNLVHNQNDQQIVQINKLKAELQNYKKDKENSMTSIIMVKEENEQLRNQKIILFSDKNKLNSTIQLMQEKNENLRKELQVMKGKDTLLREQLRTIKELRGQKQNSEVYISTESQTQNLTQSTKYAKPQKSYKFQITNIKSISEILSPQKQNEIVQITTPSQPQIKVNQFISQHPQVCFLVSSILPCQPIKQQNSRDIQKTQKFILSEIQNYYNGKTSKKRRVTFIKYLYGLQKMKSTMLNFHTFVDNRPSILMIIKIKNSQEIIGVYSEAGLFESQNQNLKHNKSNGFIFNANSQQVFLPKQKFNDNYIFPYDPFFIIVGNQDLKIKMFSEKLQSYFGFQYSMFKSERKTESLFGTQKQNEVQVEDYEFYEVDLN